MIDILKPLIKQFLPFAQEKMGFDRPPKLFLQNSKQEADNPMGKTGFYDPENESITIYVAGRHPKDIMRSLAHELMHHTQKCNGDFDGAKNMGEQGYAQNDSHMRNMEIQAYQASIVFRDWEDGLKETIYYEHLQKGEKKMSTKDWKNRELNGLLMERFGFKFNTLDEVEEVDEEVDDELNEEEEEEEELDEGGAADRPESTGKGVDSPDRGKRVHEEQELEEDEDEPAKLSEVQIKEVLRKAIEIISSTKGE